jgi:hypothetical protein
MVASQAMSDCVLRCAQCGIRLTLPLRLLSDPSLLCNEDRHDFIPRGFFLVSDGSFFTGSEGQFVVNLKDLVNTKHHSDFRRLNGCCGPDGCDGKNRLCQNGHEVGTERSDCWMPHAIHIDPIAVEKVAVEPGASLVGD